MQPELRQVLDQGWVFRQADTADGRVSGQDWLPASVPGTVYQDLLAQGRIPDPHVGLNEQAVQWVAECDWCYQLDFEVRTETLHAHTDLVFEGLDTFAQVWLNDGLILRSDNMFVPARVDVHQHLRPGRNRLVLRFASALRQGREQEARLGKRQRWNGDASRLYVRKAQYHYGWDWGPCLLTAGPWKPVSLHSYDIRIDEVAPQISLDLARQHAHIDLSTRLIGQYDADTRLVHRLFDPQGREIALTQTTASLDNPQHLAVSDAQFWWPAGHGAQPLYRLETEVWQGATLLCQHTQTLGLRQIRLVQESIQGESGSTFYFEVNGKSIFAGGANWIPDDNLLNRIRPERYRQRVAQAVAANMVMLRVWGGGIYEDDAFYAACDELGVLVWQDFMFACGIYPAHPAFLASVQAEAEAAIKRLRHHACLALWCGNNEDYILAESLGLYGATHGSAQFEARRIYEQLLPEICARHDPQRPYWPGSPFSPGNDQVVPANDPSVGDRHSWEIWHGAMLPYQDYHRMQARFVSEFGMQSHPSLAALESVIPPAERSPLSRTMAWHNKAGSDFPDGHRRLAVYLADTLNVGPTLEDHVYATQFVQAEAMRYAYQDFRGRWQSAGARACGGALVWQLNDCWPVTSWAIIDALAQRKPAWYSIRRALAPLAVAVRLEENSIRAWVMNSHAEGMLAHVQLHIFNLAGELLAHHSRDQRLAANGSTPLSFPRPAGSTNIIAALHLVDAQGLCLARDIAWPEPFRFYRLPAPELSCMRCADDTLQLLSKHPVKGLWLSAKGVEFADNFVDLVPNRAVNIRFSGHLGASVHIQALDVPLQAQALQPMP